MSLNSPFNTSFKDDNGNNIDAFIREKEIINLDFFTSGKNSKPLNIEGEIQINFFDNGIEKILTLNKDGIVSIKNVDPPPSNTSNISGLNTVCGAVPVKYNITNYTNNYEFRLAEYQSQNSENPTNIMSFLPEIVENIATLNVKMPVQGSSCYVYLEYKKNNDSKWQKANSNNIILDVTNNSDILKVRFAVNCLKGHVSRPILPTGTNIYIIKEEDYQSTPNSSRGGALIYPEDVPIDGKGWKK